MECIVLLCVKSSRTSSYRKGDYYGNRTYMGNPVKEVQNAHFCVDEEEANKFVNWQRRNGVLFHKIKVKFVLEPMTAA